MDEPSSQKLSEKQLPVIPTEAQIKEQRKPLYDLLTD